MLRTIIGVMCLMIGLLLLVPGELRLWEFGKSYRATYDVPLVEPQATLHSYLFGQPIEGDAILLLITIVGIIFAVVGIRILR